MDRVINSTAINSLVFATTSKLQLQTGLLVRNHRSFVFEQNQNTKYLGTPNCRSMNSDPNDESSRLLSSGAARFTSGWTTDPLTSVKFDTALEGRVAVITLSRPENRNAWTEIMRNEGETPLEALRIRPHDNKPFCLLVITCRLIAAF
jgi:hypothetical protein